MAACVTPAAHFVRLKPRFHRIPRRQMRGRLLRVCYYDVCITRLVVNTKGEQ